MQIAVIGFVPEVERDLQALITRPFSKKRTVPATETVAVIVSGVPFFGEVEKARVMVEEPVVIVTVID